MLSLTLLASMLTIYAAPVGEVVDQDYAVAVNGRAVPVYRVGTLNGTSASFASFDFAGGSVTVTVKPKTAAAASVAALPASFGVKPAITSGVVTFKLDRPRNLTLELNGRPDNALHLFANPLETDAPRPDDPNVLYFGPGVHDIGPTQLKSGQTVYLAGGAIVRPTIPADEKPTVERNWKGNKVYRNLFEANGAKNLTIRGRGILDLGRLPWHARTAIVLSNCDGVLVEGITIVDAPAWVVASFGSSHVTVRNIKQICRRENSDGIDLCNTQHALVENCFLRNNDDEVCVKTTSPPPAQESRDIMVRNCVIWNERARGMGITSETRADISDVTFRDCDVIHDFSLGGDCGSMAVLVSDSGTMRNITFENIRVADIHHSLFDGWIGADMWGHDPNRGRVDGVILRNITAEGPGTPLIRIAGCDATHLFENVTLDNVRINGKLIAPADTRYLKTNEFVKGVK